MSTSFRKRIFSPASFYASINEIFAHIEDLRKAARGGRVSKAFAEKIMLVVSQVNGCRYCNYGHTKAALAAGISEQEIRQLMNGEWDHFPENEVVALTFAQHYAESGAKPDLQAWQRLVDHYGEQAAEDILAYLRMITFGNLFGNTFDAFLSRLCGKPAQQSKLTGELCVLLSGLTVVPAGMVIRFARLPLPGKGRDPSRR